MRTLSAIITVLILVAFRSTASYAQAPRAVDRLDLEIDLDGLPFEEAWNGVKELKPVQYEPINGAEPSENTSFLVAYTDEYLYLALRAFDSDPEGVRGNSLYRDRLSGDDHFEVLIDTFNDNETAVLFTTTPEGIRKDAAIFNDASGGGIRSGGWINGDFNTFWDVETVVNEQGWFAEMRIPFSSLSFEPDEKGRVTFGFNFQRKVARKTERLVYPAVARVANWAFLKPSLAEKMTLEGITPKRPAYLTPYLRTGLERSTFLNSSGTDYEVDNAFKPEVGFDIKYNLTNNISLDGTVNTDFAQAEADNQQINLTRFSLFFPEKRQFFQERAGIFDFRTGGLSRLFHSRRIGLAEDGTPQRILGGARIVGRTGLTDFGVIQMQTAKSGDLQSENFGVYRLRRQVWNPYSYVGAMMTSRIGTDESRNLAYGLDAVVRLRGDDYLTFQWAQTFDERDLNVDFLDRTRYTLELARRRSQKLGYSAVIASAGSAYNPGLGFTQRNAFTLLNGDLNYTWLMDATSSFISQSLSFQAQTYLRHGDGSVESGLYGPTWRWTSKSGSGGRLYTHLQVESVRNAFSLDEEVNVLADDYTFLVAGAERVFSHTDLVQFNFAVQGGTFYDGWQSTAILSPLWYVSPHLNLSAYYQFSKVEFPDRDQGFNAHLLRMIVRTALNTKLSVNSLLQFSSASDYLSANVRFRYNFREGNDLWLVWNHGLNSNRQRLIPMLPLNDTSTLLLKYTHTFAID